MTNHEMHIMLWDRLAQNGALTYNKATAFRELFNMLDEDIYGVAISAQCFACQESEPDGCESCPITWSTTKVGYVACLEPDSEFRKWHDAATREEREHWAAIVRDMAWEPKKK